MLPRLDLPDWTNTLVVVLVLLGFPGDVVAARTPVAAFTFAPRPSFHRGRMAFNRISLLTICTAACLASDAMAQNASGEARPEDTEVWTPVPPVVVVPPIDAPAPPPSDAIVLFDGAGLNEWVSARDGSPAGWVVADTYVNGMAGSIYKQSIPLVNASRPPGQWQTGVPGYSPYESSPIMLQAHQDPSPPISFRNIWVREL